MVTIEQIREMVAKAEAKGACSGARERIRELDSVEAILQSPDVRTWIWWYQERIGFDPEFFPIIEPHLATYCLSAASYAIDHKKAPFPAGHEAILHCDTCRDNYERAFPGALAGEYVT